MKKPPLSLVGSTATGTAPPRKLGQHGLTLWNTVQGEYRIDDIGGIENLAQICVALDRAEQLACQINIDGPTIMTKTGLREHPALKAEIACRSFITRNLQRLGLNIETIKPVGRPRWLESQAMTTTRTPIGRDGKPRITPEIIAAYIRARDSDDSEARLALHLLLNRAPWEEDVMRVDDDEPPKYVKRCGPGDVVNAKTWAEARALRLALEHAAGDAGE